MQKRIVRPNWDRERNLREQGFWPVAGVDEAGRGAIAGPVVAAAVVADWSIPRTWHESVRDSKQLSAVQRERVFEHISADAVAVGTGIVPCQVIDRIGIAAASRRAMHEALQSLSVTPSWVLIDWFTLPSLRMRQEGVPGGDSACISIACASIVAKVTRDRLMEEFDAVYDGYAFALHKGYGTTAHLRFLAERGVSPVHRVTFEPVRRIVGALL